MSPPEQIVDAGISEREAEVLRALSRHLTNAEIAQQLFISVRTVESHVSSLLRKLQVGDRRALALLAEQGHTSPPGGAGDPPSIPTPLTPFVGRAAERADLARELREHRLVTAVGPGGIGKTRLALAVAGDLAADHSGGVWYVDLVPVSDPATVAPALAARLGLDEVPTRSVEETVIAALSGDTVLILDNCEHLVDGVAPLTERLLARCPGLRILATSRTRLLVPFERVFPVPGLSVPTSDQDADDTDGDAVALFLLRAEAVGHPLTSPQDIQRVAALCRALDGMALAIELAAARLPTLGLDGLETGLGDRFRLLSGGPRLDDRHRSLRATLDWSYNLAEPVDQAVLRRVAVFAAPFSAAAASEVVKFPPLAGADQLQVTDALGRLAEQSLVIPHPEADGIRYRMLETVKQYGTDRMDRTGETEQARDRHLRLALEQAAELEVVAGIDADSHATSSSDVGTTTYITWRTAFDQTADELRAALGWARGRDDLRTEARTLASQLGNLLFHRGLLGEAQHRYEQAADRADGTDRVDAFLHAAGAAWTRHTGDEALRLYREGAESAGESGDNAAVARCLSLAATLTIRCAGIFAGPRPVETADLLRTARGAAEGNPRAEAAVRVAEAWSIPGSAPEANEAAERAVTASRELGDPVLESAALDYLTVVPLAHGPLDDAAASTRRRVDLIAPLPQHADKGNELLDTFHMAVETHTALGDLAAAKQYTRRLLQHPVFQEGHVAALRLAIPDALAGNWPPVLAAADRFLSSWERQGRRLIGTLDMGSAAVAMVHGLRGDEASRKEWLSTNEEIRTASGYCGNRSYVSVFGALVLLHHGHAHEAVAEMGADPDELREWYSAIWRHWYAALWAEAAVLAGLDEAPVRLDRAREITSGNPVASALVDRADAWSQGDQAGLQRAAQALERAGSPYQQARTLVLMGGRGAEEGAAALAGLGAAPMAVTPPR